MVVVLPAVTSHCQAPETVMAHPLHSVVAHSLLDSGAGGFGEAGKALPEDSTT